jgi:hypothetical protein
VQAADFLIKKGRSFTAVEIGVGKDTFQTLLMETEALFLSTKRAGR